MTFNYTSVLERVYQISSDRICHIHGRLTPYCKEKPVLGHGNADKINVYREKAKRAYVDLPYFQSVQLYSPDKKTWNIYYYDQEEQDGMKEQLLLIGVMEESICMKDANEFWN